jgi:hypothetical protein
MGAVYYKREREQRYFWIHNNGVSGDDVQIGAPSA